MGGGGRQTYVDKVILNSLEVPGPGKYRTETQFRREKKDEVSSPDVNVERSANYSVNDFFFECSKVTFQNFTMSKTRMSHPVTCLKINSIFLFLRSTNYSVDEIPI